MRPLALRGHTRGITQVKFNLEGDIFVSAGKDTDASVWFSHNGERLGTLIGHNGSIFSVDIDKDSKYCITASSDETVKLWNLKTGEIFDEIKFQCPVYRVEFSPDGSKILIVTSTLMKSKGHLIVHNIDRSANIIEKEPVFSIETHEEYKPIQVASWSYNGRYIAAGRTDGSLSKFDGETGQVLKHVPNLHEDIIKDIQFSQDRTYFITSSRDKSAKLIDILTMDTLKSYDTDSALNSACITPVKEFVILAGGQDAKDVTTTSSREGRFESRFFHKIFEDEIGRVSGHFGPINYVAVSPQGTSFVSGGEDGFVRLHHFDKSYFDFKYEVEKTAEAEQESAANNGKVSVDA
ncbi:probable Eukaryotic translation initiation factor 3 subunit I [Saccharomycodes ludwigii]|uniref:Eukaryotic translation initiation factor 3 subunit I n=1 Tax=Saccharomycodes ludwigii TaxID=36035 RepID=A0A376B3X9_9ASCO|nr:probable Eukaryotic translation initiation factor 3 subunit I [Saccharomycodes ludwigii]